MTNYRQGLLDMPSYDGSERVFKIQLNANESTLNLPPLVEERVLSRLSHVAFNRYPNEQYDDLRGQIAKKFAWGKENILLGNGSSEIIEKIFFCFGGDSSRKIVYPEPSFSMYKIYAKAAEATGVTVPLDGEYRLDADDFIATVNGEKAVLAVLCNPNNPTGGALSVDEIEYIAQNISCPFLVDEAYVEFYGHSSSSLAKKYPHLIVARTFSKAFGLAAARVGYMLADAQMVENIGKAYMPYHINVLSLVTADICYQMRDEFTPRIAMAVAERKRLAGELKKLSGLTVYPSETNFLLLKYRRAGELNAYLESLDIGLRSFSKAPSLENCLRLSMGNREENDTVFAAIKNFVEGRG